MTDAEREALVERMAEATFMRGWATIPGGMSAVEVLALRKRTDRAVWKMHVANARAALSVAEPVVREDERDACARVADGSPSLSHRHIAAAIRARGAA